MLRERVLMIGGGGGKGGGKLLRLMGAILLCAGATDAPGAWLRLGGGGGWCRGACATAETGDGGTERCGGDGGTGLRRTGGGGGPDRMLRG